MIVVDTNVLAYALIEGPKTHLARRARAKDPEWRVPPLCRHEFLNVLATYVRRHGTTLAKARALWTRTQAGLDQFERAVDMGLALGLAAGHGLSAYDAEFLALAIGLGTVCVTEDQDLLRAAPELTRSLEAFCGG